ncbi:MAG: aminotransferase class I/II-fold pyridoxal phosphate-dependent enzyme [Anaerolineae bacterium]
MPPPLSTRLKTLAPYPFAGLERRIAEMTASGKDVIRLDIGSPDQPPASEIVDALARSARNPAHHGYAGYYGRPELRQAMANYYARRFGVTLDPKTDLLPLIGSKEGIYNLAFAYLDAGDVALIPGLGYPTYTAGTQLAGADAYVMSLQSGAGWTPDLDAIPADVLKRAKIMWLNYPNNPTTALVSMAFLARAVEFARKHNLLLAHDNPYADVCFDGYVAPSVLQAPGAKEVAVEFNSLSKSHNMGGWRVGMVAGQVEAVAALGTLKTQIDSGIFRAIQDAAVEALSGDQEWLSERNAVYAQRRDLLIDGLRAIGCAIEAPRATIYLWVKIPPGELSSVDFCNRLLDTAGVSLTPGTTFGEQGEGYARVALGQPTRRIQEAVDRLKAAEGRRR